MSKIGIFSGSFDPIHGGHLAFALKAAQEANLDKVYFLAELKPRRKTHPTHFAHRQQLLKIATKPFPKLGVLELPDKTFSTNKTLPRLKAKFQDAQLYMLLGSDLAKYLPNWPHIDLLLADMKLIIGVRKLDSVQKVQKNLGKLKKVPKGSLIITSQLSDVSSKQIRESLKKNKPAHGQLKSTETYIKKNWLYSAISADNL